MPVPDIVRCFLIPVGYTSSNININWRQINPVVFRELEMPQFELDGEGVVLSDYPQHNDESKFQKLRYVEQEKEAILGSARVINVFCKILNKLAMTITNGIINFEQPCPKVSLGYLFRPNTC